MKTNIATRISALLFALPVLVTAQTIPYAAVKSLQDCVEELRRIDGAVAELTLEHTDAVDTRSFRLALETPKARTEITVASNGTFRLPPVAKEDEDNARIVHTLNKGALTLSVSFDAKGQLPLDPDEKQTIAQLCASMVERFRAADKVFEKLFKIMPDLKGTQIALVGVAFSSEEPSKGRVVLKNGEKAVASFDLSQTGTVSWMFEKYDPKTHRIVSEPKSTKWKFNVITKVGKESDFAPGAILLTKAY